MLEKIRQEIVVIIISISSMLITAFATIYGVQITNEHNLKMQNRQFKIETARKEIEKLEMITLRLATIFNSYLELKDDSRNEDDSKKIISEITSFMFELLQMDKEIYNKYKEFVEIITYEKNEEKASISFIQLNHIIKHKKEEINKSLSNPL